MNRQEVVPLVSRNRSHLPVLSHDDLSGSASLLKERIISRGDLPHVSMQRQLDIIDELLLFPFGCYIAGRKGADGYWTDYLMTHCSTGPAAMRNKKGKSFLPIEDFLLNRSPIVLATRERFRIFQKITQRRIRDGVALASVPCGVMRDLLTLDYSGVNGCRLYGVDIDPESLKLAAELAEKKGVESLQCFQEDAWNLPFSGEFDVLNSNGLNVYESDREQVVELYRNFHRGLKVGGILVCGVLTSPPFIGNSSDWDLSKIPEEDLLLEQILHHDILEIKWRNFRSIDEISVDFMRAGFRSVEVYYDRCRIFPTVVAHK